MSTTAPRTDGYSRLPIVAHWLAAVAVIALFLSHEAERGSAAFTFHVSGGALLGLFLLWRVWHRIRNGTTQKPDQSALLNLASQLVIWGFLIAIIIVIISGYLLPWTVGRPIDVADMISIPSPMERSPGLHAFVEEMHEIASQAFVPLLGLHILGAAKHAFVDKDGIANRMFRSVVGGR